MWFAEKHWLELFCQREALQHIRETAMTHLSREREGVLLAEVHHFKEWLWRGFPLSLFPPRIPLVPDVINDASLMTWSLLWWVENEKLGVTDPPQYLSQKLSWRDTVCWRWGTLGDCVRSQTLIDSTTCCWSAQPLTSSVTSLLMKEMSKILLLHPMKFDVMLYRKAVQTIDWS